MACRTMPFYECRQGIYEIDEFDCTEVFVIVGEERALVVDTGTGIGDLKGLIEERITDKPYDVVLTHNHVDHMGGAGWFDKVYIHPYDMEHPDPTFPPALEGRKLFAGVIREGSGKYYAYTEEDIRPWPKEPEMLPLRDGQIFDLGGRKVTVWFCPGHTNGEVVLIDDLSRTLICGDACNGNWLFDCSMSEDPRESAKTAVEALKRIYNMRDQYDVMINSHHDFRGYGSPLPDDMLPNLITLMEQVLSGDAQFEDIPDALHPGKVITIARYKNVYANLVGRNIREM